jgi:signal transduction histidine kinase
VSRSARNPRSRAALVVAGVALPWVGNVLYLSGAFLRGFDVTPVAFALSGVCLLWALYHHQLLTLVPIARDLVVDSMEAGVFVLDLGHAIVDFNPAAHRLSGCTGESVGQAIERIVPWWRQANAGGRLALGASVIVDVGTTNLEVQMTAVHDAHGERAGSLVVMRDIAERRAADAERQALERRMQEQQRVESLSVLTAGVAHDFNNLLTGILGNAELVTIEAPPGSDMRASAQAIVLGAQQAADLVDKMLAYAGQRQAAPEPVDMDMLVRDMGALLQATIGRHCTISYEAEGSLAPITGDPTQLRQVLLNLVTNAAEASAAGSIVTVTTGMETLTASAIAAMTFDGQMGPGVCAFLEVADSGCGIDEATLKRVFDPFFSTKTHGRGLGLAAVQGIVRSHGGALRITSAPGRGTRVRIWLPVSPTEARPAVSDPPQPLQPSS